LIPCSTPYTCAIENARLNMSPESFMRTPASHHPGLLPLRASREHGQRHRSPLSHAYSMLYLHCNVFCKSF
jgi:hypothetical protein